MIKWILLSFLFSAPILTEELAVTPRLFFLSSYDRYSLKATDGLEADKNGSGYSLAVGSYLPIGQGYLQYGIGYRHAQAKGENYDRSQEVAVSDVLLRLGYIHPVPGLDRYLHAGLTSEVSRGKGSSLGYEDTDSVQTVARLSPLIQLRVPVDEGWRPYLEGSHSWDLNNKLYRETRTSFGLGIMLDLGQTQPEPAKPVPETLAVQEPITEPTPPLVDQSLAIGSGVLIFPMGEAELHASLKSYLRDLSQMLKEEQDVWTRLAIIGFAESSETQLYGSEVSGKRALSVKDFFLAQGFESERVTVGEPVSSESDALSRQRVDIFLFGPNLDKLKALEAKISSKRSARTIQLRLEILTMDKSKVDVGAQGKMFLLELGKLLNAHGTHWESLTVTGFTDTRGNAEINQRVAIERGERQAAVLIGEGIAKDRITSLGVCTSMLLDARNPTSHWNRRAEVEIHGVVDAQLLKAKIDALVEQTRKSP